jgi:hypothetical protein
MTLKMLAMSAIKDLVCFIQPNGSSSFATRKMLQRLDLSAERTIMIELLPSDVQENGYTISENNGCIGVRISLSGLLSEANIEMAKQICSKVFYDLNIDRYLCWYHDPEAFQWTGHLFPVTRLFHCTELLSPNDFGISSLLKETDVVVTSGYSAYEYFKGIYPNVFNVSTTVDVDHFYEARYYKKDPIEQALIPHPRIGYYGPLDDRVDYSLVATIAQARPDWHFVLIGPPINNHVLFELKNVHLLGDKSYERLPDYVSGWDVGFIPFHQDRGRFLNPAQCIQLVVAGKPVVCTPVPDVIRYYGSRNLIHIAGTAAEFISKIQLELRTRDRSHWHVAVNELLQQRSADVEIQKLQDYFYKLYVVPEESTMQEANLQR